MIIQQFGDLNLPKILLLHPMLADGKSMLRLVEPLKDQYCFIAPDFTGQGNDNGEFESAEKEARMLLEYLKEKDFCEIELMFGASLGARIGLTMLEDPALNCKTVVFEGAPLYRDAKLIYWMMCAVFLRKQKKALRFPGMAVEKMTQIYGIFGESMGHSFERMSPQSLKNIIKACSTFNFPEYSAELQKRIFFEWGSKDTDAKQRKTISKYYPHVHFMLREGYGHCEYMAKNYKEYAHILENYMKRTED